MYREHPDKSKESEEEVKSSELMLELAIGAYRRSIQYQHAAALPLQCPVLTSRMLLPDPMLYSSKRPQNCTSPLCPYALAMRCPVLTSTYPVLAHGMLLRLCYAMPGTDMAYAATRYMRNASGGECHYAICLRGVRY
eukprot:74255-Rhodomonas_salina.1